MYIVESTEAHLNQLVDVFEEYREFCGFKRSQNKTKLFLKKLICDKEAIIFIAVDSKTDSIMGFVNLFPSYSSLSLQRLWILNDLGVSSDFRGKGVSKALIHKVQEFAKETNAIRVELKTALTNTTAQSLYRAMNFIIDSKHVYYRVPY
ncbi:MAG: GNAT superfamily N-acetyltransferase [Francisella sp.]|jgi:GNAT superfamily N-acetyltransferase